MKNFAIIVESLKNLQQNTEGIYVVIIVRYPTGQSSRMMGSMVFVKPIRMPSIQILTVSLTAIILSRCRPDVEGERSSPGLEG
jgi:hypothetical protein